MENLSTATVMQGFGSATINYSLAIQFLLPIRKGKARS